MSLERDVAVGVMGACGLGMIATAFLMAATIPEKETAATSCSVQLEETQAVADFWREQALAMRTDGVDSLRPVPENDKKPRKDL